MNPTPDHDRAELRIDLDPEALVHLESVWFRAEDMPPLAPRSRRLAGFEVSQPRRSIDSVPLPETARCLDYVEQHAAVTGKHGGMDKIAFASTATMYGAFTPHLIVLSAWTDVEALGSFVTSSAVAALYETSGIADAARTTGRLDRAFHASAKPFDMFFRAGAAYELCALWRGPQWTPERQAAFFESVAPSRERHRAGPGLVINPERGDYCPNMLCLSEWPALEEFRAFVEDPEHTEVSRIRDRAFERMDATATRVFSPSHSHGPQTHGVR